MLGKLLKYEFKDAAKLFLPLNALVLALSAVWSILTGVGLFDNNTLGPIEAILLTLYILSIMALFIITAVYLALRFYKTTYANQGYLTHTLPVSSASILNSKVIASISWLFLAMLVCICSVGLLLLGTGGLPSAADLQRFGEQISYVFGIGTFPAICLIAALFLAFCLDMTMMVFASLSIGQLFNQYRIPAAVVTGVAFYIIQQISSFILLLILGIHVVGETDSAASLSMIETSDLYRNIFLLCAAALLLFGIVYYVICFVIMKRKLNLE